MDRPNIKTRFSVPASPVAAPLAQVETASSVNPLDYPSSLPNGRHHRRKPTYPHGRSSRKKPRRWPLLLRFIKGSVHGAILLPVTLHALFTVLIVCIHTYGKRNLGLPAQIIPSLSIVVGLMLVFRNQTSWNRFWEGRNNLTVIITSIRNLTRSFLSCSFNRDKKLTPVEKADIERVVRILMAIPYAVKNHLRAEWGAAWAPVPGIDIDTGSEMIIPILNPEYADLLPAGIRGHEDEGLGLPLQLTFFVESFIKRGVDRGWFHAPQASQMTVQINTLIVAYGNMETIRMTPMPVAHLIHQLQVLALYGCVLPFAMVDNMGWWSVPIVTLVIFTLYGIEGIGSQLEDPFGYDRNDIKMDGIAEDCRVEIGVMLKEWRRVTYTEEQSVEMFSASRGRSFDTGLPFLQSI